MSSTIKQAIEKRKKIRLVYSGGAHVVEPYAFGIDRDGNPVLLCFQSDAGCVRNMQKGWVVVQLSEMIAIAPSNESFTKIRSGYVRDHPVFQTVLIQV